MTRLLDALLWPLGLLCPVLIGITWADVTTGLDVLTMLLGVLR